MITIPYNNPNILYSGRFINDGVGVQSAFQGNLTRFRVQGTTKVQVVANIKALGDGGTVGLAVNVDNTLVTTAINFAQGNEIFEGERTITITLPDTNVHDIIFKMSAGLPTKQLDGSCYIKIKSYLLDDGATVSLYPVGDIRILGLGDSWMSAWHDWLRLMDTSKYELYPVAYGGAKSADINNAYPYQIGTTPKTGDGTFDKIIIGLGINDYVAGISETTYKSNISSLISKVRVDHPTTPIYLLNPPRNLTDNKTFDKYGGVLSQLASENTNATYISSEPVWNDLVWLSDTYHLSTDSKQLFANFVDTKLSEAPIVPSVGSVSMYLGGTTITLPVYLPSDIDSQLRVYFNGGEKALKLVDVNSADASKVQVFLNGQIKAISK
jgi:hypothetical protein